MTHNTDAQAFHLSKEERELVVCALDLWTTRLRSEVAYDGHKMAATFCSRHIAELRNRLLDSLQSETPK